ncbi:unnamed protein product [Medioppia subpectinata]|uniref:Rieske domain-containing protein n=1 Tax=Medioppia subpectinata TaxID=1979941 RepID=A0A7R9KKB2_9ACAR|nr:unnamed protein product [Medioppia subpectinata]CAG2103791.1 unnamed protein product [Medioppia subpectinata]
MWAYITLIMIILSYILWKVLFEVKESIYDHKPIGDVTYSREMGYPNTWFIVMDSRELPVNQVKAFELCGQQLVGFRGPSGAVHVLSAYCPHLGANLGVGGHVVTESESGDDCIQCPFHGWRFGGDGQCKQIPNLEKSELKALKARVKRWRVMERNDMIYVWHHSSDAEPDHCLPDLSKKYNIPNLTVLSKYTYKIYTSSQGVLSAKFIITGDGTEDSPLVVLIELYVFNRKTTTMHLEHRVRTPAYDECHIKYIGIPGVTPALLIVSGISLAPEKVLFTMRFLSTPTLWNQIVWNDGLIWGNLNSPVQPIFTKNDTVIARTRRIFTKFYD